jgi:hypothetical protein
MLQSLLKDVMKIVGKKESISRRNASSNERRVFIQAVI